MLKTHHQPCPYYKYLSICLMYLQPAIDWLSKVACLMPWEFHCSLIHQQDCPHVLVMLGETCMKGQKEFQTITVIPRPTFLVSFQQLSPGLRHRTFVSIEGASWLWVVSAYHVWKFEPLHEIWYHFPLLWFQFDICTDGAFDRGSMPWCNHQPRSRDDSR